MIGAIRAARALDAGDTSGSLPHAVTPSRARLATGLLGCALLVPAGVAAGATFTVNSTADMGDGTCDATECTLREAVTAANATAGADTIDFDLTGTSPKITLASPLPDITQPVSILGGTADITIQGPGMANLVAVATNANDVVVMDLTLTDGDIPVGSGANLVLDQTAQDGTYADVISGAGSLEKDGPKKLTLSGANTYTGGTTVTAGTLVGTSTSLQGAIVVAAGAELDFNQSANGSFAGDLSGDGTVTKLGTGQLTLSGDNSGLTGDFVFQKGTLLVDTNSAPALIVNQGNAGTDAVVLNQNFAGSFTGEITGRDANDMPIAAGSVSKAGTGNVSLEGTIRAGIFTVVQGPFTLTDAGVFEGGEFRVDSGATLQGQSVAGNVMGSAVFDGTVSPGGAGSVGALHTSFDSALFQSSSVLQIDVSELAPEPDQFDATSVTVEDGAKLQLLVTGQPDLVDALVVQTTDKLTCPTGNPFCFAFDQSFFFFDVMPTLTDTELRLTFEASDTTFADVAQTPNEMAVAQVLDTARADAELGDFFAAIGGLEKSQGPALLNAMSGEIATGFTTPRLAAKQRLDRTLELRVRGFASRAPGFVPEAAAPSTSQGPGVALPGGVGAATGPGVLMAFDPAPGETGFGAWIDGYGVFGRADGKDGAGNLDYGVYGTTLGIDARVTQHFLVGAAAGYARIEPDLRSASGTGNMGQGALFAAGVWDRVHVAGWGRYAYGGYETHRPIGFGVDVTAKGSFDGWDASGHGEAGVRLFSLAGFELRPLASIDYARVEQGGYTEKGATVGADSLNLQVPGQSWNSLVSGVGARVHRVWELEEGTYLVPELHASWLHEFEDTDRRVVPTLIGVGLPYSPDIRGAELDRNGLQAGIGWTMSTREGLHVYADYEIDWNPQLWQHAIKAGFRFLF
jgi:fibronectin-binding autotransporter adhesin